MIPAGLVLRVGELLVVLLLARLLVSAWSRLRRSLVRKPGAGPARDAERRGRAGPPASSRDPAAGASLLTRKLGLMHEHFRGPRDWASGVASLLVTVGALAYWFAPNGTACSSAVQGTVCETTRLVTSGGLLTVALSPLVVIAGTAVGVLFFKLRHWPGVWIGFGIPALAFYVVSFGVDVYRLPAAVASLVAVLLPGRPRPA